MKHIKIKFRNTSQIGRLGEDVACEYLKQHGFIILDRNYYRKVGEIDIIASKMDEIHFIEVKSVSYETKAALGYSVTHETWQPEELAHSFKLHQIAKTIAIWLSEQSYEGPWHIDVIALRIVPRETFATIKFLENITE